MTINTFAHNIAVTSNALYTSNLTTLKSRAEQALRNTANACASVLVRFANDVGHLQNGLIIQNNVITGYNSILNAQGSVTIPDGVTAIGSGALQNAQLSQISIPASVSTIGASAFENCTSLGYSEELFIPSSVTSIGDKAFFNTALVKVVSLSRTPPTITSTTFSGHSLMSLEIPIGTSRAYHEAGWTGFRGDYSESFVFYVYEQGWVMSSERPDGIMVTGVESGVQFPDVLEIPAYNGYFPVLAIGKSYIASGSFAEFSGSKIIIPAGIKDIDNSVFPADLDIVWEGNIEFKGTELTKFIGTQAEYKIPDFITAIGANAFANNSVLSQIVLPVVKINSTLPKASTTTGIKSIGDSAFLNCTNLSSIVIPNDILYIGSNAFKGCNNLTIYTQAAIELSGWSYSWNSSNRPVFWSCGLSPDKMYVTFVRNGMGTPPITEETIINPKRYAISMPYREGYIFGYWYVNLLGLEVPVTPNEMLSKHHNQYFAKWVLEIPTVTFNLNSGTGSFPAKQVSNGQNIAKPATQPAKSGYILKYWALSTKQTQEYNWSAPVTGNITLVAIWEVVKTVTFNLNGGTGSFPAMKVGNGQSIAKPASQPTRDGYTFKYWALSTKQTQEYNWSAPVTGNITLVAIWEENKPTTFIVTFTYRDEFLDVVVAKGDTISPPIVTLPIMGWCRIIDGRYVLYDWSTPITENITLVALIGL